MDELFDILEAVEILPEESATRVEVANFIKELNEWKERSAKSNMIIGVQERPEI